ncbi:prolyl aminopeptidase [Paxillus involutus ATCC 200175]|nr:prolyl aminopeptidase [Paxillus involutus ATCC 200175]
MMAIPAPAKVTELEAYTLKGSIKVIDRFFEVPLNYSKPEGEHIRIFVRNLVPLDEVKGGKNEGNLPYFLYLQGGPGFEVDLFSSLDLAEIVHKKGYQTLWLDQRGTGLSSPINADVFKGKGDQEIAQYLKQFRADNIVRDCEAIRNHLLGKKDEASDRKWTIMGQSFGGFCATTYLSFYADGLKEVFMTGGLPPLVEQPDAVYEVLTKKVKERNVVYYTKYPQDIHSVRRILDHLENNNVVLPNGGQLTVSRWLQLGMGFGMHGGIDLVHQLVLRAIADLDSFGSLSYGLLNSVQTKQSFDTNPIYAILHEAIYCQNRAANWSAHRILKAHQEFQWDVVKTLEDTPIYFTGEMIFPDMFDDYHNLRPLKNAAELLAHDNSWDKLYDPEKLAQNTVKVNAATYYDDMYVDFGFAQDTAAKIANTEQFITNQSYHNGIRKRGEEIMKTLFELSKRERD